MYGRSYYGTTAVRGVRTVRTEKLRRSYMYSGHYNKNAMYSNAVVVLYY